MYLSTEVAGLGGNVKFYSPLVSYTRYMPLPNKQSPNTLAMRLQASFINGFGGVSAPPYQRFYMGGEYDIRGFDIRSISPVAFLPSSNVITLTNPDGTPVPKNPSNPRQGNWTIPIPVDQIVSVLNSTNWQPRMSTGLELQMFLPVVNAPFRIYWAFNALRLDTPANPPIPVTRAMFPVGAAGDYTYGLAKATYSPNFLLREPRKTFRFTVATTF